MRIPKPKFKHSPQVHADIIKANGSDAVRLAHCLQQLGWTLADAAWAAVNWPLIWMAAAIANERDVRSTEAASLLDADWEKLRAEVSAALPEPLKPRKTNRIHRTPPIPNKSKGL
jgi:predicted alpha/beta-hydrolase family hydrolase